MFGEWEGPPRDGEPSAHGWEVVFRETRNGAEMVPVSPESFGSRTGVSGESTGTEQETGPPLPDAWSSYVTPPTPWDIKRPHPSPKSLWVVREEYP